MQKIFLEVLWKFIYEDLKILLVDLFGMGNVDDEQQEEGIFFKQVVK